MDPKENGLLGIGSNFKTNIILARLRSLVKCNNDCISQYAELES